MARRKPWLTAAVAALTATVSVVGLLDNAILHDLERRGGELGDAEPWRLVTSLLVHDGWWALLANLVLLGLVGAALERRHSRVEWTVLYLAAGAVGELVGIAWQPHGAGNSVAALGLAGALALDAIRRRDPSLLALGYAALVLVTLIGVDVGGIVGVVVAAIAYLVPGATIAATRGGAALPGWFPPALGWSALGLGAVLVALENIHGPALLAGAVVALAWTTVVRDRVAARTARTPRPG